MIFGIDIGLTGAVAVFTASGQFVEVFDIPTRPTNGVDQTIKTCVDGSKLAIELQRRANGTMPMSFGEELIALNMGTATGKGAYFSMGSSYGRVMTVFEMLGWPIVTYRPADWKRHFSLNKRGQDMKEVARMLAINLYPGSADFLCRKKDHNRAESILIGRFGMDRHPSLTKREP